MLRICPSNIILLTKISLFNDPVSCLKENKGIYAYVINGNIISQKNYSSNVIKDILKIKLLLKFWNILGIPVLFFTAYYYYEVVSSDINKGNVTITSEACFFVLDSSTITKVRHQHVRWR